MHQICTKPYIFQVDTIEEKLQNFLDLYMEDRKLMLVATSYQASNSVQQVDNILIIYEIPISVAYWLVCPL